MRKPAGGSPTGGLRRSHDALSCVWLPAACLAGAAAQACGEFPAAYPRALRLRAVTAVTEITPVNITRRTSFLSVPLRRSV